MFEGRTAVCKTVATATWFDSMLMHMKEKLIQKFKDFLKEENGYQDIYVEPIKMSHGTCCCCRDCGQYHDECVCENNRIFKFFQSL